jgi:hypothetical protein
MSNDRKTAFDSMGREDLLRALEMFAKNWLAHDGCWFLAAEEQLGDGDAAIELDARSWERFAAAEAHRITTTFNIPQQGGLDALERALGLRMYSVINAQRVEWSEDRKRLAVLHGRLPCSGSPAAQGASRFSLQKCRRGRVRDLCPNHRLTHPYDVLALSSGSAGRPLLRVGIQHGITVRSRPQSGLSSRDHAYETRRDKPARSATTALPN